MIGIVIVSHSARLAEGVVELAREMAGPDVRLVAAGGLDLPDRPLGTDAALVLSAVEQAWSDDGVLVLMDLGSAVLSAEMAVEMLPDERRPRVRLCAAPVVEGAVAAAVAARLGEPLDRVADEARGGLAAKLAHLAEETGAQETGAAAEGTGVAAAEPGAAPTAAGGELRLRIDNPLGLHARPAARFVQAAASVDARVTVTNLTTGRGPANARSLNAVATLGVRQGHEVLVRAEGAQATAALDAIRALADRHFDEPTDGSIGRQPEQPAEQPAEQPVGPPAGPSAERPAEPSEPPAPGTVLPGLAASAGLAVGPARLLHARRLVVPTDPAADPAAEWERLTTARAAARAEIVATRDTVGSRAGSYDAAIFDAHLLFLDDEALLDPARQEIDAGRNAAQAWADAVAAVAQRWAALDDPYLRERAADLAAVSDQVLGQLLGAPAGAVALDGPGIVVARELTPGQTGALDPALVRGIATALGGPTGHSAILARSLGIPAVVGLGESLLAVAEGSTLLLDGDAGTVVVEPDAAQAAGAEAAARRRFERERVAREAANQPAVTRDGTRVEVAANAGSAQDARAAVAAGADGIGLLRTEFLFLDAAALPSEDAQLAAYREIAEALGDRPLIIRTLDVGADKPLPYLPRAAEDNPALGVRGLRLGLRRPPLLAAQLRAVLRLAAERPVRLMFPMVATVDELERALELLDAQLDGPRPDGLQVGIMVEVPAAALTADALAPLVDFFSIGTNDLAQYTLAADRVNADVAGLADALHPAVLALIHRTAEAARAHGRWVGVCGELAGDPAATAILLGLGVRELSVTPVAVPTIKQAVRDTDLAGARAMADQALAQPSAAAVRHQVAAVATPP